MVPYKKGLIVRFKRVPPNVHGWGDHTYLKSVQGGGSVEIKELHGRDSSFYVICTEDGRQYTYGDRRLIMENLDRLVKFKYVLEDGEIQTWDDIAMRPEEDE